MKYVLIFLADWANGLFAVLFASLITGTEVVWWHFLIGLALAHSPDLDAVGELLRRGKVSSSAVHAKDHREGLHYPVLWLLGGCGVVWLAGYWGWVFVCATMLHFVNDCYGTGWGVKWLWPLSRDNYKFLGRRVNQLKYMMHESGLWEQVSHDERRLCLFVVWKQKELPDYIVRYGTDDWIEACYLKLNWMAVTEYLFFIVAFVWAVLTLLY